MRKLAPLVSLICAAAESGVACEHAIARQAPRTETLLTGIPQLSVSIHQPKGSKTIALESVGKTGAAVVGGPVAGAAALYGSGRGQGCALRQIIALAARWRIRTGRVRCSGGRHGRCVISGRKSRNRCSPES